MDRTILIIDDEQDICCLFKKIMAEEGYRVLTATSGEEGLIKIKRESPSIIFLDIGMPGLDGIEVLNRIRNINKELVVIILTGLGSVNFAREMMKSGAHACVTKPFDLDEIKATVKEAIEKDTLSPWREGKGEGDFGCKWR